MASSESALPSTAFRVRVLVAFAAIYLIWGSTYLGIRIAIETLPPLLMAGMRFTVAGVLLYAGTTRDGTPRPTRRQWRAATIVGGLLLLGGNGLVTWAEERVASGLTALLVATVPLWMVLLDWAFLGGRRPAGRVALGLILGLVGIVLLVGPTNVVEGRRVDVAGAALVLLAALFWSVGSLYARRASLPEAPLLGTAMEMLAGGVLLILAAGLKGEWGQVRPAEVSLRSWLAFGYLTVLGSIVAFTAYTWLLRVTTPARVATYAYVNPVVAVFLGWTVGGEPLTAHTLLAAGIIVLAVVIITTNRTEA